MSSYPEADEAQQGYSDDGYNPYATQPTVATPYDQCQSQYSRYSTIQHYYLPIVRSPSFVAAPPHDPFHQQRSQDALSAQETYSAIPLAPSPPQLVNDHDHIGALYNPYDDQQTLTPSSRPRSQFELASKRSQTSNIGAADFQLSQRDNLHAYASVTTDPETNFGTPRRATQQTGMLKTVQLFRGNFVLDSVVPTKLLEKCDLRTEREFTHMRYSAATCDPDGFDAYDFTLRQSCYNPPRHTELFIVMTMYNEDEELFCHSMHSVVKNIAHLCQRGRSRTWGTDGWKKVVVCIVADGRQKINPRTLEVLAMMGIYQDGVAKNIVNRKLVTAHIYEYTTQVFVSVSPSSSVEVKSTVPVQVIFCLKERNQKKINSHRWFFNAFAPILQPNVCVLLDVGTVPGPSSIYHLWKAFNVHPEVGGACGEVVAYKGTYGRNLLNPLVAAQNFEYKMSNILDKPLESVFGYITVLPGPLERYFQGEKLHGASEGIFTANMYLAEDRILCWELVSKREEKWILHYVKSAFAITDVPDRVPELISQRRRWLNGSFFAAVHSIFHFHYIYRSSHSFLRKFWIHVEMLYQLYNLIFSWFALGNYYISFVILTNALRDYLPVVHYPNLVLNYFYLGLLIMCFLLSLGNRPQGATRAYALAFIGFALITVYMTAAAFLLAWKGVEEVAISEGRPVQAKDFLANSNFRNIVLSLAATLGLYVTSSLLFFEPWHMVTSFSQYLLMAPSYIAVLNVYAFANIHDVSWGTKGDNKVSTDLGIVTFGKGTNKNEVEVDAPGENDINAAYERAIQTLSTKPPKAKDKVDPSTRQEDYYKTFRTNVLLVWTLSNAFLAVLVLSAIPNSFGGAAPTFANTYLSVILFSITGLAFVRFLGSIMYLIVRLFTGE